LIENCPRENGQRKFVVINNSATDWRILLKFGKWTHREYPKAAELWKSTFSQIQHGGWPQTKFSIFKSQ